MDISQHSGVKTIKYNAAFDRENAIVRLISIEKIDAQAAFIV
jgi:uncharacterized protein YycO